MRFTLDIIDKCTERMDFHNSKMSIVGSFHKNSINKELYNFLEFNPFTSLEDSEEYIKKILKRIESVKSDYRFLKFKNKFYIVELQ